MPRSYHGMLRLEASETGETNIESFIKTSIEFEIFCPTCGPKKRNIKKNGPDKNHSARPQFFFCKRCNQSFYAHTSWVFEVLAKIEFERIIVSLFEERIKPKAVAAMYGVSASLISKILHHFQEAVDFKLNELAKKREQVKYLADWPICMDQAIWWDETFFRLGKVSWCLILLIDARGKPLAWKFGKTRTVVDYLNILQEIEHLLLARPIFIGDGASTYKKVCKQLRQECFLIEHLHTHPWEKARLHHFEVEPEAKKVVQTTLEIPYNSFTQNNPQVGRAIKRHHKIIESTPIKRSRGRPRGSKDKVKRQPRNKQAKKVGSKNKKKRGPKTVAKNGRRFHFHPKPIPVGWYIEWLDPPLLDPKLHTPSIESMELLLDLTYKIMKGGPIQSNRIENINRYIKAILPDRGLKTPDQTCRYITYHLNFRGRYPTEAITQSSFCTPVSRTQAFKRVLTFFSPSIRDIRVKTIVF